MAAAGRPDVPETGHHTLGPHVVGQRIVVRRLVRGETGPTGGPAFTDLLGTCLSWADGACVIAPDSPRAARTAGGEAEPVRIALADIVSGKPVPPRPSVRHRVDPAEAQRRAMALFPDTAVEPLGDWLLRSSPTQTNRRANSVLAFGPTGVADDDALAGVADFYARRDTRPIAAVLVDSPEERLFRDAGWGPESDDADTVYSIAPVSRALRAARRTSVEPEALQRRRVETPAPESSTLTLSLTHDDCDIPVASGVAAYADDWVGFRSIEVDPAHRRRGLGAAVMAELLEWGAEQGATTAYLQVIGDNAPALALYERLGFAEHHRYRYLAPA